MKLIVGLGNIGAHFENTRHNTGFKIVDILATAHDMPWQTKDKHKALVAEGEIASQKVLLVKPTTFYNLSGETVQALKQFYKIKNADVLVVHDELDLPFGTVRTRVGGSDAGNNGIKSVAAHIGPDFARLRVGIANELRARQDPADFVLGVFTTDERQELPHVMHEVGRLVRDFVQGALSPTTVTRKHMTD